MHNFLDCGTEYLTKILKTKKNIKNQFWLDVFNAHIELQSNNQPKKIHKFQASAIFYNKNIKVANTSIYYQTCYERGIQLINDVTGKNGNLLTYQEVKELFNIRIISCSITAYVIQLKNGRKGSKQILLMKSYKIL